VSERVVVVGAGRMGIAIGGALLDTGTLDRLTYLGRAPEAPAGLRGEYIALPAPIPADTTILLLAVADSALPDVAKVIGDSGGAPDGCVALHLAGAVGVAVLAPLEAAGYATGSMHPLQTLAAGGDGGLLRDGVGFALDGDPVAVATARRIVASLRGIPLTIEPALRPLYHAAAVMVSNYTIALMRIGARLLEQSGVSENDAVDVLLPLLRGTVRNVEELGPAGAMTGPITRGDADTIRLHLAHLSGRDRMLYCGLGLEMLELARAAGLPEDRARRIELLLTNG
jgi:predicted short-subunit dehydrogenase-like oxidoreductase (DUF2520 family)